MWMTRWNPVDTGWARQMTHLQDEMNRLFSRWGDWSDYALDVATFPPLNVWEEEEAYLVEAELPGLNLKDLEIYVTGQNQLSIKGTRDQGAPPKAVQHRQERQFGKFTRTLSLPSPVDENKIDARFENGVLKIRLPKHERAKPRRIQIKS